jgi:phosphoribosylformylglycinamidine synthase
MKAGVVTFPGSNCDDDAVFALTKQTEFQVVKLWHKDELELGSYDLIVFPGGFSYGDYLRCGAMAALSPVVQSVKAYANSGGLVLGICNGFQILCETGLLPGALVRNDSLRFVCRDVTLSVCNKSNPWTSKCDDQISLPIAHGDGRYIVDAATAESLQKNGQVLLKYSPLNPNGSAEDIAGVVNEKGNVFGLMPHPERATDLGTRHGQQIWQSVVSYLKEKRA